MKILNLCKGLLAVGTVTVVLSGCNIEEHRKDREERREDRREGREERRDERAMERQNEMNRNAERSNAMRRQQAE